MVSSEMIQIPRPRADSMVEDYVAAVGPTGAAKQRIKKRMCGSQPRRQPPRFRRAPVPDGSEEEAKELITSTDPAPGQGEQNTGPEQKASRANSCPIRLSFCFAGESAERLRKGTSTMKAEARNTQVPGVFMVPR
mgnify:CR=1 FL=1